MRERLPLHRDFVGASGTNTVANGVASLRELPAPNGTCDVAARGTPRTVLQRIFLLNTTLVQKNMRDLESVSTIPLLRQSSR